MGNEAEQAAIYFYSDYFVFIAMMVENRRLAFEIHIHEIQARMKNLLKLTVN